jgi:histidinol phosphatase-like enzyme (inositol monophosphatase family)
MTQINRDSLNREQNIQDRSNFLSHLAHAAKASVMPYFRNQIEIENKAPDSHMFDPVTLADKACETVLREAINSQYPADGILGEEYSQTDAHSPFTWVIDPIDGTRAFMSGLPTWGILIGLICEDTPQLGMVIQPFTGETYVGGMGKSALWHKENMTYLSTRACSELKKATLFTTDPSLFNEQQRQAFEKVETKVRLSRYGCDCYAYAMLASGYVDLVIEPDLKPYDILPIVPIIESAGGTVVTWDKEPLRLKGHNSVNVVAVGDKSLLEPVLNLLQG